MANKFKNVVELEALVKTLTRDDLVEIVKGVVIAMYTVDGHSFDPDSDSCPDLGPKLFHLLAAHDLVLI